jgi:hypothetical protein
MGTPSRRNQCRVGVGVRGAAGTGTTAQRPLLTEIGPVHVEVARLGWGQQERPFRV